MITSSTKTQFEAMTKTLSKTMTKTISSTLIWTSSATSFDSVMFFRQLNMTTVMLLVPAGMVALLVQSFGHRAVHGRLLENQPVR